MSEIKKSKMDLIKYMVGSSVVGAGLVTAVILMSDCATSYYESLERGKHPVKSRIPGGYASIILSNEPQIREKQLKRMGKQIVERLREDGEFDKVEYFISNFGDGQDLVINGYYKTEDGYRKDWAVNLNCACRSVMKEKKLLFLDISDVIINDMCNANVVTSPSFRHSVAEQLNQIMSVYIGNNEGRCEYWYKFIQETHGPTGPE